MDTPLEILIIDDDASDRTMVRRAIQNDSIQVNIEEVDSFALGLASIRRRHFDCIFVDYQLPDHSGLALIREIRNLGIDIPVIMLTGYGNEEVAAEAIKIGATDYLSKDKATSALSHSLRAALRIYQSQIEKKQAEEALQETQERYRLLVEGTKDYAIFMLDSDGNIASWNPGAERILGYKSQEILGKQCDVFFTEEDRERALPEQELEIARLRGKAEATRWLQRKDGTRFWGDGVLSVLHDASGQLHGYEKVMRDATDRKLQDEALRYQLHLMDAVTKNAADSLFLIDVNGRLTFMNQTAEEVFGWKQEELIEKVLHDAVHYKHRDGSPFPILECPLVNVAITGQTLRNYEDYFIRKDGAFVPVSCSNAPILTDGESVGAVLVVRDITERREAEHALAEKNLQITNILESITDAFFALDHQWRFTYLNPQAEPLLHRTRGELLGKNIWQEFPEAVGATFDREYHRAAAERIAVKFTEFYPPLDTWFEVHAYPTPEGLAIYFRDVSEQREREKQQREAAERQRAFVRDVLASVTDGKLCLCTTKDDLPEALPQIGEPVILTPNQGLRDLRRRTKMASVQIGLSDERWQDLVTAVGEGSMNAVVHAGGGQGRVCTDGRSVVQVWIEDKGTGIPVERLPRATLEKGYTTAGTMGHGFKMVLQTADRLYLLTGTEGTTLVLEQYLTPPSPYWL